MYLIVGLGNPGPKYEKTRHNVGFHVVERLAGLLGVDFAESKWKALVCRTTMVGQPVVLVKPQTYMNLSGEAVQAVSSYFKIDQPEIIVIHDDLDLDCGRLKIAVNRGAGGHNGIKSIIAHLGGKSFVRIKIGIGRPPVGMPVDRYVLSPFTGDDAADITVALDRATEAVTLILEKGVAAATQEVHSAAP